jgi:hypothetical protein
MNTVGKTLVIINLVFALLVAGFLVIDFATRETWKAGFDKLKGELDISRANTRTAQETNGSLLDKLKTAELNLNTVEKKLKNAQDQGATDLDKARRQTQDEAEKSKAAELEQQKLLSEKNRLIEEVKDLTATLKNREKAVLEYQDLANKYRTEAVANEQKAKSSNERSMYLMDENRKLQLELVKGRTTGGAVASTGAPARSASGYRNPPPVKVKGVVEKVSPTDAGLVQISIGSDHGLEQGQTLEVFRTRPQAEYIGTIRLTDVNHHSAVGQLVRPAGAAPPRQMKVGDEVATSILN